MQSLKLNSVPTLVESPFIIAKVGDYTFGSFAKTDANSASGAILNVNYPNFMQALSINKVNGAVNNYTLTLVYQITKGDDPNLLERIFSSVSDTRKIVLSYGDYKYPSYIYKEEAALITNIYADVNIGQSRITYTLSCISSAVALMGNTYNFPQREDQPSNVIKELVYNAAYALTDVFKGMVDKQKVLANNVIASNDKKVLIEAKQGITLLDYINYLVNCMSSASNTDSDIINNSKYYMAIRDGATNNFGGSYFTVQEVSADTQVSSYDTYEVDINYPGENFVTSFSINNNQQWSILFDYSNKVEQSNYIYKINNQGQLITEFSPSIARSNTLLTVPEVNKSWWTKMTAFPISATLTIKGLTRPTMLMNYIKVNVYFYGRKHISSGLYIITKEQDQLDSQGYKTTLSLTRVGEDS